MAVLDQACEVAGGFTPMSPDEIKALLARTRDAASRGLFEPFKTSSMFDATATSPDWLGEEPERIKKLLAQLVG